MRPAATWDYSAVIFDATVETILMAYAAQLRAQHLLLAVLRRRMQRHDGRPNAS
jgi:hypothetical protein